MKTQYVNLITHPSNVSDLFMVQDVQVKSSKKGSPFASFKASDKTGSIDCIMFDCGDDFASRFKSGEVFHLTGSTDVYNNKLQLKVSQIGGGAGVNVADFVKATKYDIEGMWKNLVNRVENMQHHNIKAVAEDLLLRDEWSALFKKCPAATGNHHAFIGGLLEHTEQMVRIGDALFDLSFFATELNKDLCTFGLMFHDFGKIFEYSTDPGFKKIESGILVGHISMVSAAIYQSCAMLGVPDEERDHMMHVVLAHHGKVEWGSPVPMATPEAVFVHHVDHLHGDVFGMLQKLEEAGGMGGLVNAGSIWRTVPSRRFSQLGDSHEQQDGF